MKSLTFVFLLGPRILEEEYNSMVFDAKYRVALNPGETRRRTGDAPLQRVHGSVYNCPMHVCFVFARRYSERELARWCVSRHLANASRVLRTYRLIIAAVHPSGSHLSDQLLHTLRASSSTVLSSSYFSSTLSEGSVWPSDLLAECVEFT